MVRETTAMIGMSDQSALSAGLFVGAASLLSIGPNNLMLIREGLARGRTCMVATVVAASYATLLLSSMVFSDALQIGGVAMRWWLSWLGIVSLTWFAFSAIRAALFADNPTQRRRLEGSHTCLKRALTVVWSNPLTYLELLVIPASICATLAGYTQRIEFIGAVLLMKVAGCYGYAFSGGLCAALIKGRPIMRVFDFSSGLLLSGIALVLASTLIHD